MRWYITVAAVHDYQRIRGLPPDDDGPGFDEPAKELSALAEQAKLVKDEGHRAIYRLRTPINGRMTRLEFTVSLTLRAEGDLPQLVRVRDKDGGRQRRGGMDRRLAERIVEKPEILRELSDRIASDDLVDDEPDT